MCVSVCVCVCVCVLWSDLRTTHLLLGEMNVHRQLDNQCPKALILDWCKHRKIIDHLIDYATSEW